MGATERVFTPGLVAHPEGVPNDKAGTWLTASIHMFTAVVGAGVLALPNAVGWLGWVAGPLCISMFFVIQLASSRILAMCYAVDDKEFSRYHHAVRYILGRKDSLLLAAFQLINLILVCVAYVITGGISLKSIATMICNSNGTTNCFDSQWQLTMIFGAAEVALSQVPSLAEAWWVSIIGAVTGLIYSFIALILGIIYAGDGGGSIGGIPASPVDKAFSCLNALGSIAFAFSFSLILLEIQDTVSQPPAAVVTMKRAINVAVTSAFVLYLSVACVGYAALGNAVPGLVLQGFPEAPDWVMLLALFSLVLAMLTSFQLFCQPVFDSVESHIKARICRRAGLLPATPQEGAAAAQEAGDASKGDKPDASGRDLNQTLSLTCSQALEPRDSIIHNTAPRAVLPQGSSAATALRLRSLRRTSAAADAESLPAPDAVLPASPFDQVAPLPTAAAPSAAASAALNQRRASMAPASSRAMSGGISGRVTAARTAMSAAMFTVGSGFGNEEVPQNDVCLLPFWQRFLLRTAFVVVVTVVGTVLPFFSDIVGLVGGLTYFPLSIYFPYKMYIAVYKPQGAQRTLLLCVGAFMLLVAIAATTGSLRSIIQNASTYTFFN